MPFAALILVVLLPGAGEPPPDLMALGLCASKGRIQDEEYNPDLEVVDRLLEMGTDAIPFLISRLDSDRSYEQSPICFWPDVREGDVALRILTDLFTDDSWVRASHPQVCIESNFGSDFDPDEPLLYEMPRYVAEHGRASIVENWTSFWEGYRDRIVWDEDAKFFRIRGIEPAPCPRAAEG